jgi:hypothetical protein
VLAYAVRLQGLAAGADDARGGLAFRGVRRYVLELVAKNRFGDYILDSSRGYP